MRKTVAAFALLIAGAVGPTAAQDCLHGPGESSAQQARRDQALAVAARINLAQSMAAPGQGRRYRPLEELPNVPPPPPGFELRFQTDGRRYAFSLKDRLDPCGYAVFSDDEREIYEGIARRGPVLVPLETR
jgi:hypothetical protein